MDLPMLIRLALSSAKLQLRIASRDIETLMPLLTMPLNTLVAMAVFVHAGREDLAAYGLCASFLLTVGQMALLSSSGIVSNDRFHQLLELFLAAPAPYVLVLAVRTMLLTTLGLVGFVEGWLITKLVFGVTVTIYHPGLLAATLAATAFASGGTAVLMAATFAMLKNTRTLQLTLNGPLFLLGGVLVPATFLPFWLQPLSPLVYFFWSANLVRGALDVAPVQDVALRLGAVVGLGLVALTAGALVMERMLSRLRHSGQLGIV